MGWCMVLVVQWLISSVLCVDIVWQFLWVRASRRGWALASKWGWRGWVGGSQGMECLNNNSMLKEREGLAEDVEIFEAAC
jgi:hypothetical protein